VYRTLTWNNLIIEGGELTLKPRSEINQNLGINLTPNQYNILGNTLRISIKRYYKEGEKSLSILQFMGTFKKGSKYFRKIISQWDPRMNLEKTAQVKTFLQLIDFREPSTVRLRALYTSWNNYYFNSNIRVFLFKYYNNILGLNSRVSHFNPDIDGACTFCSLACYLPAPKETFVHLFYDCIVVNKVLNKVWDTYIHGLAITKSNYFLANYSENEKNNYMLGTFLDIFRFHIWQSKLEKKIPVAQKILAELEYSLYTVLKLVVKN
jgi:hypothetical protein